MEQVQSFMRWADGERFAMHPRGRGACLAGMPQGAARVLTGCSGCAMQLSAFAPDGVAVRRWLDAVTAG